MEKRMIYVIIGIVLLMLVVSGFSIASDTIYASQREAISFGATDIANLLLGVPYLLAGAWLLHKRHKLWLWVVPGGLFYVIYIYMPYIIALRFNRFFLPHILMIALSLYMLIIVLASQDDKTVLETYQMDKYRKVIIGVLILLGATVAVRQSALAVSASLAGQAVSRIDMAVWFDDLVLGSPVLFIGAYCLYKRMGAGYVIGPAMLLCYAVLSMGLMPYFYLESIYFGSPVQWDGVLVVAIMILICLAPLVMGGRWLMAADKLQGESKVKRHESKK